MRVWHDVSGHRTHVKTNRHTTGYLACGAESAPLLSSAMVAGNFTVWRHSFQRWPRWASACIAPDMRGYGRSSTYARNEDFAQELIVGTCWNC